ncbi:hypothetical protein [Rhodococcus sp. NPDC003348]
MIRPGLLGRAVRSPGNVVAVKFGNAATHRAALASLDSIDAGLAALPAARG